MEILLGVSASAACFKAAALASQLVQAGHGVTAVLSSGAARMVTPLQFSCLTGRVSLSDEWKPQDPAGMDHIQLARRADLVLLVPATADRLGSVAHGLASDLLGSCLLAAEVEKPRIAAPSMNPEMWRQAAVQRNLKQLALDGWQFVGPVAGPTACGEDGLGRMAEVEDILAAVAALSAGGSRAKPNG
jgi:phosphopantothenoylcysteine synthetase/decarboxylase